MYTVIVFTLYFCKIAQSDTSDKPADSHVTEVPCGQIGPLSGDKGVAVKNLMSSFYHDETAATAIEYGLIAGLIAMVVITVVGTVGTTLSSTFYAAMASAP